MPRTSKHPARRLLLLFVALTGCGLAQGEGLPSHDRACSEYSAGCKQAPRPRADAGRRFVLPRDAIAMRDVPQSTEIGSPPSATDAGRPPLQLPPPPPPSQPPVLGGPERGPRRPLPHDLDAGALPLKSP